MNPRLVLPLASRAGLDQVDELLGKVANGKTLDVDICVHREKRSLDANAYFWTLLEKLGERLNVSRSELYLHFLQEYGKVFDYLLVVPDAVERITSEFRTVVEVGKGKIGEREAVQLQVFYGSSTYSSAEMSRLIDGVVYECKLQGIETMTPREIADMNSRWEGKS
jgi:hypothetical protein